LGIQGKSIEKDYPLEKMIDIVHECRGRVMDIKRQIGYSRQAIYDYLDVYPELQEARRIASFRFTDEALETGQEMFDTIISSLEDHPALAYKAAEFLLKHTKHSPYYADAKADGVDLEGTQTILSQIAKKSNEIKEKRNLNARTECEK